MAKRIYAMMRDNPHVWLMVGYDAQSLRLASPVGLGVIRRVPKDWCRVGTAPEWRTSWSFRKAWEAGGGEKLAEQYE